MQARGVRAAVYGFWGNTFSKTDLQIHLIIKSMYWEYVNSLFEDSVQKFSFDGF